MLFYHRYNTPIGILTGYAENNTLTGLFSDYSPFPSAFSGAEERNHPIFRVLESWLTAYFAGENPEVNLPLEPRGTAFQQRVWRILRTIPYGGLMTYGEIAAHLTREEASGKRMSAQAVGGAVGRNPILILIPCHRVVGANGNLTGFGGGIDRKYELLRLEGQDMSRFYFPKETGVPTRRISP